MRKFLVIYENLDGDINKIIITLSENEKANELTFTKIIDTKFIAYGDKVCRLFSWSLIEE